MQGQFIFSTCNRAGLRLTALLRNTVRDGALGKNASSLGDMRVSLKVFHAGILLFEAHDFAKVPAGGYFEISEANCPLLVEDKRELLLIAHCDRGEGDQYFPQEHQLVYEQKDEGVRTTSLVYDQMPIVGTNAKPKPILLLAPKVWVSNDVNTFISFANVDDSGVDQVAKNPWEITFLRQNGDRLITLELNREQNDNYVMDVKSVLAKHIELTDQLQMLNVVARVNGVSCVILTFVQNQKTGALALEHSLSPHYYMNGDFVRVRNEAFVFPEGNGVTL